MYVQPGEMLGGGERQGVAYISGLRKLGINVVPVVGPSDDIPRALEQVGIRDYVYLPDFFHPTMDRGGGLFGIVSSDLRLGSAYLRTRQQLERLLTVHPVDVVIASRFVSWLLASPIAKPRKISVVWRAGGCITKKAEAVALRYFSRRYRPDVLVCNSNAVRDTLASAVSAPVRIIPNGIDVTRFDRRRVTPGGLRRELGIAPEIPVLAVVSRPTALKNFEMLAEVLTRTAQQIPSVRLLIAGDSASRPYYEAMFARLGLAERTTFLGHRDDIEAVYEASDLAVLTSHSEGSPNAILEAMSMSIPVVGNGCQGVTELITHGVNGFYAPRDDVQTFTEYVVSLIKNPALRRSIGTAGRTFVEQKFSDQASAQKLADLLYELGGRRPRPSPPIQSDALALQEERASSSTS